MTAMTDHESQPHAALNILTPIDQAANGIRRAKEGVQDIGERFVPLSPRNSDDRCCELRPASQRAPSTCHAMDASRASHSPPDHYGPLNSPMLQSVQSLEAARP
jgi:hypothetical protein